jgi:DNA-binding transcriptional MerR regulator
VTHPEPTTTSADSGAYSARELAELAGTTVRTIHYYTAEGLLPPPAGSTRGASYSAAHLARLRIIAALRDEGLALGKIRERLASLTDVQVERVAATLAEHLANNDDSPIATLGLIDLEMARQNLPPEPVFDSDTMAVYDLTEAIAPGVEFVQPSSGSAREYLDRVLRRGQSPAYPQIRPPAQRLKTPEPAELWYQYRLGDGIELRLREDQYRRLKGQPSALVDAVRSCLGRYAPFTDTNPEDAPDNSS